LPPHTLKAPDVDIVAVLLEFGADPNELDWEGTSPLKDALDAALRRLHWHMGKRERELQKFADICSRLVSRSGASGLRDGH
jgi:ankyrin repeat protein